MKVRFLLDENISPRVRVAIQRHHPEIDILRVGDKNAPALNTLDPEILHYLEQAERIMITRNRASMPVHVAEHQANGRTHWGIFRVRPDTSFRQIMETVALVYEASEAEEWINEMHWIPF
jgi:hypothetical protein